MKAVVVGGRGQSGRAIVDALRGDGWDVTATSSTEAAGYMQVDGHDLDAVVGDGVDLLVDVVAYRPEDADRSSGCGCD